jgi:tyrosyl-tRNA synthetase
LPYGKTGGFCVTMEIMKNIKEKLREALTRSVDAIYPSREVLEAHLAGGEKFKIYIGIDPTSPHLHIGHLSNLLILKRLSQLGAKIVILIGDFTARIGDPTDKTSMRQPMTGEQIEANLRTFKKQICKALPVSGRGAVEFVRNSKWLKKLNFEEMIKLAHFVTVQQMIERDMFQDRLKSGKPIGLHEFLYPLMQGYDSVGLDTDGELGGTDQTFNMLMGRHLLRVLKNKNKVVVASKLLVNPRTKKKLSKTDGSLVNLDDTPTDIFGKIMSLEDEMMFPVAEQCTEMPMERIKILQDEVASATLNPRDAKLEIAHAVVSVIHGKKEADVVRKNFVQLFSKKEVPDDIRELLITLSVRTMQALVVKSGVVGSNGEAWRLIKQGALEIDGKKITDPREKPSGKIAKIGKHHFFRLKVQ